MGQNMSAHKKSAFWDPQKCLKSYERKKKDRKETKVSVNNCQLRLQLPPWVAHASRMDQNIFFGYKSLNIQSTQTLFFFWSLPSGSKTFNIDNIARMSFPRIVLNMKHKSNFQQLV